MCADLCLSAWKRCAVLQVCATLAGLFGQCQSHRFVLLILRFLETRAKTAGLYKHTKDVAGQTWCVCEAAVYLDLAKGEPESSSVDAVLLEHWNLSNELQNKYMY